MAPPETAAVHSSIAASPRQSRSTSPFLSVTALMSPPVGETRRPASFASISGKQGAKPCRARSAQLRGHGAEIFLDCVDDGEPGEDAVIVAVAQVHAHAFLCHVQRSGAVNVDKLVGGL